MAARVNAVHLEDRFGDVEPDRRDCLHRVAPPNRGSLSSAHIFGSKGRALLSEKTRGLSIKADKEWYFDGPFNEMYQVEHDELFASIRKGQPINNGEYMTKSTLLAIMGRMAAYTGRLITWDMALNSQENLSPKSYDWGPNKVPGLAVPGVTRFF